MIAPPTLNSAKINLSKRSSSLSKRLSTRAKPASTLAFSVGPLLPARHGHDPTVSLCLLQNKALSARKWGIFSADL